MAISFFDNDPIGLLVIAAAPFLIVTTLISGDRTIMGKYRNGKLAATLGWAATVIIVAAGVVGIWNTATGKG